MLFTQMASNATNCCSHKPYLLMLRTSKCQCVKVDNDSMYEGAYRVPIDALRMPWRAYRVLKSAQRVVIECL